MKHEALENLLIDRALGQLSPEVEALLAEHLAASPDDAQTAAELREVVALATAALHRTNPKLELPPRIVALPRWPITHRVLAMAASFVAGAGMAFLAMRGTSTHPELPVARDTPAAPVMAQAPKHSPELERELRKLPFWSKERAYLIAEAANETNR